MKKMIFFVCAVLPLLGGCNAAKDEKSVGTAGNAGATAMASATTPSAAPVAGNVTTQAIPGTTTIATAADGSTAAVTTLASLPDFAPQYPGSTMKTSQSMATPDGTAFSAIMITDDPIDKIMAFYKPKLLAGGLPIAMEQVAAESGMLMGGQRQQGPQAERLTKVTTAIITVTIVNGKKEIGLIANLPSG
jgi:hypothetical protein